MSNEFEWKTEDEAGWDEEMAAPPIRPSRRFPWKPLVLVLVVALVVLGGVRWQINRQVSAAAANVENEVRATHRFLQQVAARQDEDLFRSLLSGRDPAWTEVQRSLLAEGLFANPSLLGGTAVPLSDTFPMTVTLSPDFFSAEVQSEQSYHLLNPQGITETVTLRHTAVYRKGESRWLYAPPDDEFWGRMVFHGGEFVSMVYPERDEAVALRLAQDLDDLAPAVCRELGTRNCLQRTRIQVRFSTEPAALLTSADTGTFIYILNLPTPSLVGLPVDEAGYQALFRAYGTVVATAVITQQVNYQCCRWQLLYQALLERQLHKLGLKPWPLTPDTYDQLLAQPVPGGLTRLLVNRPSYEEWEHLHLYAFVEFLETTISPEVTLADMQRTLAEARSVTVWVNQYVTPTFIGDTNTLDQALFRYMLQQTTYAQVPPPPFPLPTANIQLVCNMARLNSAVGMAVGMYEYRLPAESWQQLFYQESDSFWVNAQPVPTAPELVLLIEYPDLQATEITYTLLERGEPLASFTLDEGRHNFYLWGSDPHGRYLLLANWDVGGELPEFRLLDVAACRQGACLPQPLDGSLIWSSDGRHTLMTRAEELQASAPLEPRVLWLGDAVGANRQAVGVGLYPFWLDERTYGYERLGEWVTAVVGENSPRHLLSADDLLAAIPQAQRPEWLFVSPPVSPSHGSGQMYVQAGSGTALEQTSYDFLVTLTSDLSQIEAVSFLGQNDGQSWTTLSPDGRWLVTYEQGRFGNMTVRLKNVQTGMIQTLPSFSSHPGNLSWSPDGKWYARPGDGLVALGAPDAHYERYIFHEFNNCSQVYWRE